MLGRHCAREPMIRGGMAFFPSSFTIANSENEYTTRAKDARLIAQRSHRRYDKKVAMYLGRAPRPWGGDLLSPGPNAQYQE